MSCIYKSIDELIGSTPLLELVNIEKRFNLKTRIFAKLEFFNPTGSIKDRAAKEIIDDAERSGRLKPGAVIIEPTSGNTGIGIACVAAARGYKAVIVMPDSMSEERQKTMKAYGAELVLTPGCLGMKGAIDKAEEILQNTDNAIIAGQFVNSANCEAHRKTTGPEIWKDTDGKLDTFIACVGTGGTLTGTGEYLKSKNPEIKVIAVEPETSAVLSGGEVSSHKIQGIGAGFVPEILNTEIYDEIITVSDEDAYSFGALCAKLQGVYVGISSGAALKAAVEYSLKEENFHKDIVVIFPDSGDRYLSVPGYFD